MNAVEEKEGEKGGKEEQRATNGSGKHISPWMLKPKREELMVEVDRRLALGETKVLLGKMMENDYSVILR